MSHIVDGIGLSPGHRSVESGQHPPKTRGNAPPPEAKAEEPPEMHPRPPAPVSGLNQSASSYQIHLDSGTMRTITEVIDKATGDVLFSIPVGYRRDQSSAGGRRS
ncbi:MAG: hypothetical protein ACKVOI_20390 [Dongiaceae bacterium]